MCFWEILPPPSRYVAAVASFLVRPLPASSTSQPHLAAQKFCGTRRRREKKIKIGFRILASVNFGGCAGKRRAKGCCSSSSSIVKQRGFSKGWWRGGYDGAGGKPDQLFFFPVGRGISPLFSKKRLLWSGVDSRFAAAAACVV